jgi:hypothetical protein
MTQLMTNEILRKENLAFVGTGGVSEENRSRGFVPAFYDLDTGRGEVARFADGRVAPMHLLDGLPAEWVVERSACGRITAIKESVIAGFIRDGYFYTRAQAAAVTVH